MAEITFGTFNQSNLQGSGLGFYGTTFGSSVQIGSYQDSTHVTDATGTTNAATSLNLKFVNAATGIPGLDPTGIPLSCLNMGQRSFHINFDHSTPVNVQNAQLRIYDRISTNYPASGVLTKVAELVNFDGKTFTGWAPEHGGSNGPENVCYNSNARGSGDLFWWGAPWPVEYSSQNFYLNSSGVKFLNFTDTEATAGEGNGDQRLGTVSGDTETIGGTGVIMPLFNSPGATGRGLNTQYQTDTDVPIQPKWLQYYNSSDIPDGLPNLGAATTTNTFGGSGVDTRHTWMLGITASPLSIGSKTQYGLYVSLEYL